MTALKYRLTLVFSLLAIPAQGTVAQEHDWAVIDGFEPGVRTAYDRASVSRGHSDVVTLILRQYSAEGNALGLPSYYQVIFECSTDVLRVSAGMLSLNQDFVFLNDAESIGGHDLEQLFEQLCFSASTWETEQLGKADLGVSVVTLADDPSRSFLPVVGVRVEALVEGSAADLAGIRVGDLILGYGNAPIISAAHLEGLLAAAAIGDTVQITLSHNGSRRTVKTVLQAYPGAEEPVVGERPASTDVPGIPAFVPGSVPSIAPPREIAPAHVFAPPSATDPAAVDQLLPANRPAAMRDGWVRRMLDYRGVTFLDRFGPVNVPEFIADLDLSAAGTATDCRPVKSTGNGDIDLALCAATRSGTWISATNGAGQPIAATLRVTIPKFRLSED